MKTVGSLTLAVAAAVSFPAAADVVTLNFDGVTPNTAIQNFYNGGTDGASLVGPNYGVIFSGPAFAIDNTSTFIANMPSGSQVMTLGGTTGGPATATLDFAAGFDAFSVMFSSIGGVTIDIWSGLDGTGTKLFSTALIANDPGNNCDAAVPYCNWSSIVADATGLGGKAGQSVVFGGLGNSQALFDDVMLTTAAAPPSLPEPGSMALVGLALSALAFANRRRRSA